MLRLWSILFSKKFTRHMQEQNGSIKVRSVWINCYAILFGTMIAVAEK